MVQIAQLAVDVVGAVVLGVGHVVGGKHGHDLAGQGDGFLVGFSGQVRHAALYARAGTGQGLHVHILAGDGGYHHRAVYEQGAVLAHHGDIAHAGDGGSDAAAGAQHQRNLRNHAGNGVGLAGHQRIGVHGVNAFVQARACGIQDGDDRRAGLFSQIHHLADLARMGRTNGAALNGEILCIYINRVAVNQTVTGHNTGLGIQHVQFDKACSIQQQTDALSCDELAGLLLLSAKLRVALQDRQLALTNHGQIAFNIHIFPSIL